MPNVDVVALFRKAAFEVTGKMLETLDNSCVISTLGLDSVAVMELISYFEESLDICIPDEDLAQIRTLGDLEVLVQRLTVAEKTP